MIAGADLYAVMCATIPLYAAMLLAYFSVKHWEVFTPSQCAGVNRFVAVFAVPVLSFHFISTNDPYKMDFKFLAADTLSKVAVLGGLFGYNILMGSRLDWVVTLFSVSTLPNTLVMGIPLLKAMYGDFTQTLMVQLLVLQCIIWYTLLLFLLEYRAATILIRDNFPGKTAASITTFQVDNDLISLDGHTPLYAESESDPAGQLRVRIRRSTSDTATNVSITSRPSNLSGAEIYSINTPARGQNQEGLFGYPSSEAYSPGESGFNEMELVGTTAWGKSPEAGDGKVLRQFSPANVTVVWDGDKAVGDEKDMSFRSTTKFVDDDDDERESEEATTLPRKMVMFRLILTMVGRKLVRNPNTYSSVLGFLWSLLSYRWGIEMPIVVKNSIKIISDAGLGMAMFSLGLFMALQPIIACGAKMAAISMAIRFMVGPAVMSAASLVVGLKGVKLHTAIVQAALPQGIVPFVFAREYGLHPDILGTGVIFGMLVSLPVTLVYYILLGL